MRAVGLLTHGGPEVLQVVELPEVHAGPGQVRIRVHAATVNPTDVMTRNGTRAEQQKADPPPYVPGMEAAGIVDEVGSAGNWTAEAATVTSLRPRLSTVSDHLGRVC